MEPQQTPLESSILSPVTELQNPHQQNEEEREEEEEAVQTSDYSSSSPTNHKDIVKALQIVESDSAAIAHSFTSLFSSLRSALSQVTASSVNHMSCFSDAAGRLQECALDASTKGNRYINSCLRLNEEMKSIDSLAMQIKILRKNVDALDSNVNKLFRLQ